jgi:hypothetical protein
LATLLDKKELLTLLNALKEKMVVNKTDTVESENEQAPSAIHEKRLDVIPISELKAILAEQKQEQV